MKSASECAIFDFRPRCASGSRSRTQNRIFHNNTNQDHLQELLKLGDPAEVSQGYLRVATENQSVVAWYVRLEEGDDPPVYHNNDDWNKDLSKTDWQPYSTTFTNFIFDMISAFHFHGWYSGMHLSATDRMPDETTITRLEGLFQMGPTTDAPSSKVFRFFTSRCVLTIRSLIPVGNCQTAEWDIDADFPDALLEFGRKVWGMGTLSETLKAKSSSKESRAKGEEILQRLREEKPA